MATVGRFCEVHEQQEQYCDDHKWVCCIICHREIFPDCTFREVQEVAADLSVEITRSQECLRGLKADIASNCTRKEHSARENASSYFDASQIERRIDFMCSKVDKLNLTHQTNRNNTSPIVESQACHSTPEDEWHDAVSGSSISNVTSDPYTLVETLGRLNFEISDVITQSKHHIDQHKIPTGAAQIVCSVDNSKETISGTINRDVSIDNHEPPPGCPDTADNGQSTSACSGSADNNYNPLTSACSETVDNNYNPPTAASSGTADNKDNPPTSASSGTADNKDNPPTSASSGTTDNKDNPPTSAYSGINDQPITQLQFSSEIAIEGNHPPMRFLSEEPNSCFVLATNNPNKLMILKADGSVSRKVDVSSRPYDLHVRDNQIYVSECNSKKISIYNVNDLTESPSIIMVPYDPRGITSVGNELIVVCRQGHKVRRMKMDGTPLSESKCALHWPTFVAATKNEVLVSDESSHRIVILASDLGSTIRIIKHGCMNGPEGLYIRRDRVYVCSHRNHKLLDLNIDGSEGHVMVDGGELYQPWSVCVNELGRRLVVVNEKKRIILYDTVH